MNVKKLLSTTCVAVGLAVIGTLAIADTSKDAKAPASLPADLKLPPGWTAEDMQACIVASTPGKQHEVLMKSAGTWIGKVTMYMPGSEPQTSECVAVNTPIMDGRFIKTEIKGDMPGMGPFEGLGIYGYDNVLKKFTGTWIDNQGTTMMQGTGELSDDGQTMTRHMSMSCPILGKTVMMREVETMTGPDTKRFEMFGPDPKTGKEQKMISIDFTKKN